MAATPDPSSQEAPLCLNCDAPLSGEYCSSCGQRDLPSRLTIGELAREVLSETFELDGRVVRTLVPFLFRPGFLTREFAAGRRARYTTPFRLFLAATLLWLFTSFIAEQRIDFAAEVGDRDTVRVDLDPQSVHNPVEDWIQTRGQALEELPEAEQAQRFTSAARETLPRAALLTLPIFALLLKLLFIRRSRYYVEHLVFALHVHAFAFVLLGIAALIPGNVAVMVSAALILVYTYVAVWKAYAARWWTSALRMLAILLVHSIVLSITTAIMVLAAVLIG